MITTAELPLNQRGAVYHLNLLPEELANIIITVGDPERVGQVSRHFDNIEVKRAHREFVTHTGWLNGQRISVISTGIGIPNIDIVMNELDALVNIDLKTRLPRPKTQELSIIRLGTTGGLQEKCAPGDIVVSQFAIGFDTLLDYYQPAFSTTLQQLHENLSLHLKGESGPFYLTEADAALTNFFSSLGTLGITVTCGGFYGPQGRQLRLPLRYPELLNQLSGFCFSDLRITNFEMETAGIFALGKLLGHRCASLSLVVNNRIKGVFANDIKAAVDQLIIRALESLSAIK